MKSLFIIPFLTLCFNDATSQTKNSLSCDSVYLAREVEKIIFKERGYIDILEKSEFCEYLLIFESNPDIPDSIFLYVLINQNLASTIQTFPKSISVRDHKSQYFDCFRLRNVHIKTYIVQPVLLGKTIDVGNNNINPNFYTISTYFINQKALPNISKGIMLFKDQINIPVTIRQ
jgi:hypothetical protein